MVARCMSIRVAIVEDDAPIRAGLEFVFGKAAGFVCVAAWASAEEALRAVDRVTVDVALVDIGLPGISGIELIPRLRERSPATQVMMLTIFEDPGRIFQALRAGASGYLVKKTPPGRLLEAVGELHRGGAPMSGAIARRVIEAFHVPPVTEASVAGLTPREREILDLLAQGLIYKEIAASLGISAETVRTHLHRIYEKLHVRNRHEAVMTLWGLTPERGRPER